MEPFDKDKGMKYIQEQMRKAEAFTKEFNTKFSRIITETLNRYFPENRDNTEVTRLVEIFSTQIFNATESVIDKDKTYPHQRLAEELEMVQRVVARIPDLGEYSKFALTLHKKAKAVSAEHFKSVVDLSGNGFRLLELNTKMHTWEFTTNFTRIINIGEQLR